MSDTPKQIAARLYPNSWIRPEGDSYADALRAAFITGHHIGHHIGHAEGDAEGYARAKAETLEQCEQIARHMAYAAGGTTTAEAHWAVELTRRLRRALSPTSPAPSAGEREE